MFDIDGTLVESFKFDEACYLDAVERELGELLDSDWSKYPHVTDAGILDYHLEKTNRCVDRLDIHQRVKSAFVNNIKAHLAHSPANEIKGAAACIAFLKAQSNVSLSIATGGWAETARLKLESAGIDIAGIPLASSNDFASRTEIMSLAMKKSKVADIATVSYFGDAEWDKRACESLGIDFVLVGNRIEHSQSISDFSSIETVCSLIDLKGGHQIISS